MFDGARKITYDNLRLWYKEMRNQCPHIPCMFICNKIDINPKAVTRKYQFINSINAPLEFVSAADGTNVVKIFRDSLE